MKDYYSLLVADIYEAAGLLRKSGELIANKENQTQARWQLLSVISEKAHTVPQAAMRLGVTRQAVQRIANELVAEGFAVFEVNPEHKGSPLLSLTDAGQEVLKRITNQSSELHKEVLETIQDLNLKEIDETLRALNTRLRIVLNKDS